MQDSLVTYLKSVDGVREVKQSQQVANTLTDFNSCLLYTSEFGHDFGTFVAVDDCYSAMIPAHEDCSHLQIGDVIEAKVTGVKPDGKLDRCV